jgi:hypothetical protein
MERYRQRKLDTGEDLDRHDAVDAKDLAS